MFVVARAGCRRKSALDATHVLYGVPRPDSAVTDVWVAPIDGSAPARVFIPAAESPVVVH